MESQLGLSRGPVLYNRISNIRPLIVNISKKTFTVQPSLYSIEDGGQLMAVGVRRGGTYSLVTDGRISKTLGNWAKVNRVSKCSLYEETFRGGKQLRSCVNQEGIKVKKKQKKTPHDP